VHVCKSRRTAPARGACHKFPGGDCHFFRLSPSLVEGELTATASAARALEFTILNAARTGEVIGSRWSEIDLEAKLWTVPAERMKAKKEHRVPLTGRSIAILKALPREGDFVFSGGRKGVPISNMAMAEVLKRMGRLDIAVHGF
jgi:integrase